MQDSGAGFHRREIAQDETDLNEIWRKDRSEILHQYQSCFSPRSSSLILSIS